MADTRESLRKKRKAYLDTFCGDFAKPHPAAAAVLADLKRFCGMTKPGIVISAKDGHSDPCQTAYRGGQRDVFLRITGFLNISEEQLFQEIDHVETVPPTADR